MRILHLTKNQPQQIFLNLNFSPLGLDYYAAEAAYKAVDIIINQGASLIDSKLSSEE